MSDSEELGGLAGEFARQLEAEATRPQARYLLCSEANLDEFLASNPWSVRLHDSRPEDGLLILVLCAPDQAQTADEIREAARG